MWGNFIFLSLIGIKPNPFKPILQSSCITTLSPINVFLIITFEPITHFFPIITLCSIIEFDPIIELFPILTFLPIKTLLPNLTFLYLGLLGFFKDKSG